MKDERDRKTVTQTGEKNRPADSGFSAFSTVVQKHRNLHICSANTAGTALFRDALHEKKREKKSIREFAKKRAFNDEKAEA